MSDRLPDHEPGDLGDLQAIMLRSLTAGDGSCTPSGRLTGPLRFFEAPPRGTIDGRWSIYRDGYTARIAEALENDFRAVLRVLGPDAFRSLAQRYVRACPPSSFDIGRAGEQLPRFLESDRLLDRLPFLADLARLEWAQLEAFVAPDSPPLA